MDKTNKIHCNDITKELIDSCSDTIEMGINSYNELERQNAQLLRATNELNDIHQHLKIADKKLNNMESIWCWIVNSFNPTIESSKTKQLPSLPFPKATFENMQEDDIDALIEMTHNMKNIAIGIGKSIDEGDDIIDEATKLSHIALIKEKKMIQREENLMK